MDTTTGCRKEILSLSKKTKYYYDLLIAQSHNWLPADEKGQAGKKGLFKRLKSKKAVPAAQQDDHMDFASKKEINAIHDICNKLEQAQQELSQIAEQINKHTK